MEVGNAISISWTATDNFKVDSIDISYTIPDDVESSFTGIIGEGVAASHIGGGNWVGSLSSLEGKKGYWAKVTAPLSFNFEFSRVVFPATHVIPRISILSLAAANMIATASS